MKGFGAVVTGTLISGEIAEGAELELLPKNINGSEYEALQVHGKAVAKAVAGQRTAVNLAGVDVEQLERGMVLTEPQTLRTTQIIDAELTSCRTHQGACDRDRECVCILVRLEVLGRVRVLDQLFGDCVWQVRASPAACGVTYVNCSRRSIHPSQLFARRNDRRWSRARSVRSQTSWQGDGKNATRMNRLSIRIELKSLCCVC